MARVAQVTGKSDVPASHAHVVDGVVVVDDPLGLAEVPLQERVATGADGPGRQRGEADDLVAEVLEVAGDRRLRPVERL